MSSEIQTPSYVPARPTWRRRDVGGGRLVADLPQDGRRGPSSEAVSVFDRRMSVRMTSRRIAVVVLCIALSAVACSSDGDPDGVVPFQVIAVAGPDVEVDPSGTFAVLTVETSIDAICAVAYGVGEPKGSIATDQEMEPAGHRAHRVVLSGLESDAEYSYRLQGVGADGRLYRSETFTFRTPPAVASSLESNLARGATVLEASSEFSAAFTASNAVDGDLSTEWSSRGDGDDAWITIDLQSETQVGAVAFRTREMDDGTAITEAFTVTVDGETTLGPFPAGPDPVEVAFSGRVIRFDVAASTGGNTGAVEVEVYGP